MARAPEKIKSIVDAARQLYAARGFDGVTLRDIASKAGVSQGLIVHHFGTGQALYEHILEEMREHSAASLSAQIDTAPDCRTETVDELIERYFHHRMHSSRELRILDWARLQGDHRASAAETAFSKHLRDWLAGCQANGTLRSDIPAEHLIIVIAAITQYWIVNRSRYAQMFDWRAQADSLDKAMLASIQKLSRQAGAGGRKQPRKTSRARSGAATRRKTS